MHQTEKAEEYFFICESIFQNLEDQEELGRLYNIMGSVYFTTDSQKALDNYLKCWKIAQKKENFSNLSSICVNMAGIYGRIGQSDSSMVYFLKALAFSEKGGKPNEIANIY